MATTLTAASPDGTRQEYHVSGASHADVEAGIKDVRDRNPGMCVTFRGAHRDEVGRIRAVGWCEEYQRTMP